MVNRLNRTLLLIALMLFVIPFFGYAQEKEKEKEKWGEGEIEKVEIEIVKERQIELPAASRNFEKVPPRPAEPIKPEITYDFKNINFQIGDFNPSIRPLRLQQEPISKLYSNYLSGGFGNYLSPYLEGYFTNKRSKDKFYGLKFLHQSYGKGPVDGKNSASGNTDLSLFGKTFGKYGYTGGSLNYENISNRFYGYDPQIPQDAEKQAYSIIGVGGEIESADVSDFNFKLNGGFSYLYDAFSASESEVNLGFRGGYNVSEESKFIINSDYYLIARKDELVEAKPRHIFKVKPAYQFELLTNLILIAGVNIVYENDTIGKDKSLHFYPDVKAQYELSKSVELYALLTGDIDKVSLHSLARENPWLDRNITIFNTNRSMEFQGGLNGKLGSKVAFATGFGLINYKDLYFYYNNPSDRAKFIVVYDDANIQRTNLFGELSFTHSTKVRVSARGDLFGYSTDQQEAAWHRPTYKVSLKSSFIVVDKFIIDTDLLGQGGAKAFDVDNNQVVTLKSALDLNVRLNYFLSKQFSIFLRGNNLLGTNYQVYLNYPVRRFQVVGGLTYVF